MWERWIEEGFGVAEAQGGKAWIQHQSPIQKRPSGERTGKGREGEHAPVKLLSQKDSTEAVALFESEVPNALTPLEDLRDRGLLPLARRDLQRRLAVSA